MDFSVFFVMLLSALITAVLMIWSEVRSRRAPTFRPAFVLTYLLGVALVQPWRSASPGDAGRVALMLVFVGVWVLMGSIIGGIVGAPAAWFARLITRRLKGQP